MPTVEHTIVNVGTAKRYTPLYVFRKLDSIDGDLFLVAYPDKMDELRVMTIHKKDVQGIVGPIPQSDAVQLASAKMPRHI